MSMGEYDDGLPAADAQAFACTMLQERFFAQQRSRGPQGLNIAMRWLVTGALSHAAAEGALQALVRRYEILHTSFREIDGRLAQEVHPSCPVTLNAIDLTALPAEERESRAEEIARAEAVAPIDPAVAPLLRASLLRLAPDRDVLLLTLHSLICDGWSTGLIVRELRAAAEAIDDGRTPDATPPDLQFADYAAWQNELLASGELDEARAYWMRQLRGASATPVPADHALPTGTRPGERSDITSLLLPGELSAAVERFARTHDATLFGMAVAALGLMLHRVTGSAEIVFGSQVANREEPEAAELIGPTVNSITLCLPVHDATTLHGFVGVANERVQEALRHQRLPFEIAENFAARHDGRPLHAANLVLHRSYSGTTETERDGAGRFGLTSLPSFSSGTQWPLNFYMISRDEGWRLSCEADAGLYEPATVEALLDAWRLCLETLATAADGPLAANVALAGIAARSRPLPSERPAVARGEPIPVHEPERQVARFHESGPRTPVVVLNNRSVYFQLARQLGEQRPFTDILMYHQDGRLDLDACTFEDFGAYAVRLIRWAQPRGPYILGGHCVYGVLAFEAARQLTAMGEKVPLVALFDSWGPGYRETMSRWDRVLRREQLRLDRYKTRVRQFRKGEVGFDELVRKPVLYHLGLLPREAGPTRQALAGEWFDDYLYSKVAQYRPTPYAGDVVLFRSKEALRGRLFDEHMGWNPLVNGKFAKVDVDSGHFDMFRERPAAEIATVLRPL
jgi:thioesterase domain-containing protein